MTQGRRVSVEDFISIVHLLGEYQFLVDEGDEDGWTSLFVEDGFFAGLLPDPLVGREAMKAIPQSVGGYKGKMRHLSGNYNIRYGETTDEAIARFYSLVSTWIRGEDPRMFEMAVCEAHLLRIGDEWMLKSNTMRGLNEGLQLDQDLEVK